MTVKFTVYGRPAQQGSKSAFLHRGRVVLVESNHQRKVEWRQAVANVALAEMVGRELLTGPVQLEVVFRFKRPRSHYRTGKHANVLKGSAPMFHAQTPDLDKLVRNVGDALSGIVYKDDSQISVLVAEKRWSEIDGADVTVSKCS